MPIGDFEGEVLRVIAANRNPDSYLGGATVLHQAPDSPRASRDVDVFHDTSESLARSVEADVAALRRQGFAVELGKPQETFQRAFIARAPKSTKLEWVFDSAFRFFPVEPDPELGWRLSFWDAATNKTLALFGRHEFRDYVDVNYLHRDHLHLGALVWAAAGKDPGLTPELILDWIKRHTFHDPEQIKKVSLREPLDLVRLKREWLEIIEESEALVAKLPMQEIGCLYLDAGGKPVCPNPDSPQFSKLTRHFGSVKGAWPRIASS
jgi:LmbE family N-acetylglucosaminyl deacetylase